VAPLAAAFGGGVYIADKSAWARSDRSVVSADWQRAIAAGQIATCPIVKIELLYSARDSADFDELEARLARLLDIPITRPVTDVAITAMRELARRRPLHHRVALPDLLIAAAAQDAGVGVLHYDHHYDRLAEVMSFESRWIAPPGSLD
jgi:predicted nucleic acid-binding protein